ncbi:MAG: SDR family oxidoreductase [Chloroflexi bacterium]|nr:SDR family oxidoreductase [Chloroflexota bacterium]
MGRVDNKVVLFVGAGEHLGRSAPLLLAQEGARLVISARRQRVLEETARMITEKGGQAIPIVASAANREDVARMVAAAVENYGRLDVLYNNIGGGWIELDKKIHELSDEAYSQIVSSNLVSVFNTCRAAVAQMLKQGTGGSIINVAASRTVRRMANPIYAYTKAGMIEMTRNMAKDYLQDGIRANCLCPGLFVYAAVRNPDVKPVSKQIIRHQPMSTRQGDPADLAYAGLYLASDESSFVTGQCFSVDGGDDVKLTDLVLD